MPPDDDRTRRRLGDETKGRIADLASGWDVDSPPKPDEAAPTAKLPTRTPAPVVTPPRPNPTARPSTPAPGVRATTPVRGDETNARIADLAAGWSVDTSDTPEDSPAMLAHPPSQSPRKKPKTLPPPPPGSREREALEAAIVESSTGPAAKSEPVALRGKPQANVRTKPPTQPVPTLKNSASAKPPSPMKSGPTETGTVDISGTIPMPTSKSERASSKYTPKVMLSTSVESLSKPVPSGVASKTALPLRADTTDRQPAPATKPPPTPPPPIKPPVSRMLPDESGEATEVDPGAHLTVPIGEFDYGSTQLEEAKLRIAYEQSTIKRDTASALLQIPEQPLTVVKEHPVEVLLGESAAQITRGDSTGGDLQTSRFERGDPTLGPDATTIDPPNASALAAGGKLRTQAALRRKRGIGGDVRYVATVLLGLRRARRELGDLELQQAQRIKSRSRHLLTLGRAAVTSEGYDHPALNKARELLGVVEDERGQHAAAVTAADSELMRVRNDRAGKAKQHAEGIAAAEAELAEIAKKLEPLEKEVIAATKKAAELNESLRRIDAQIAATEASKVAVKNKADPASIQAELATLRADRVAVERDEPRLAGELDALNPRIAGLEARRAEARRRKAEIEEEEKKDRGRSEELLAAIGAKRKVVDRASADAEEMRDKILLDLGERIYVDRPPSMTFELTPIDAIDVELGTTDRRMMELKEILSSVDKAKLARGIAVIILVVASIGLLTWFFVNAFA